MIWTSAYWFRLGKTSASLLVGFAIGAALGPLVGGDGILTPPELALGGIVMGLFCTFVGEWIRIEEEKTPLS